VFLNVKAFQFRLQTSLELAERQEQMAREELVIKTLRRDNCQMQLEAARNRLSGMEQSIRDSAGQHWPWERVLVTINYIPIVNQCIDEITDELNRAEQEVEKARTALLARVRQTRTLNRLREKEWLNYLEEWNRDEQKSIDEIAITRFARQKNASAGAI
jgi:flagellar FliJ protein